MSSIRFDDFEVLRSRRVNMRYTKADVEGVLHFASSDALPFDPDSLALVVSTLIGRKYDEVAIELPVSVGVAAAVRDMTQANVEFCEENADPPLSARSGNVLNFSGGFDSLAVYCLMPRGAHLVSMDFGGQFAGERLFFESFGPTIISTDIAGTEFQTNSWTMMGIGAILTAPVNKARYVTFGGINGASVDTFAAYDERAVAPTFPPFAAAGYINAPYALGMAEPATVRVIAALRPDLVEGSLASLARRGTAKYYRKSVLAEIALGDFGEEDAHIEVIDPIQPLRFGVSFVDDLSALYILARRGRRAYEKLIADAPEEIFETVPRLGLDFYHRYNTSAMRDFPSELWGEFAGTAAQAGVLPYTEHDWEEVRRVRELLSVAYPELRSAC